MTFAWFAALLAAAQLIDGGSYTYKDGCRWVAEIGGTAANNSEAPQGYGVPVLTVYDTDGRVLDHRMGSATGLPFYRSLIAGKKRFGLFHRFRRSGPKLEDVLAASEPNSDVASLPPTDLVAVQHGAVWCTPCEAQKKALADIAADFPEKTMAFVKVDADIAKWSEDGKTINCPDR
jgi:thiol-disulfide isomerase/thioredoxin